jgi:hypothetical protein
MNILKITQKTYHEVNVDEHDIVNDLSLYYIRIGNVWYNINKDGSLYQVKNSLSKLLEQQFHDMNGVMHEQMDLYEDDYSRLPDNQRSIHTDTGDRRMWVGTNKDPMWYGSRS